jgi:GTP-binding protein
MAFIDEIKLHLKAGDGGHGVVRWRQEKGRPKAGAAGGNGGNGGDVYVKALRDMAILARYKAVKEFSAERGKDGMKKSMFGRNGEDFTLEVPTGSIITNLKTGEKYQLMTESETILLLKGGRGGLGNEHFKASTNTTPYEFTLGKKGETSDFYIELELIVDAGLIGFPNAGKSSLLNVLTNASAKVGSYQFTTLEPNPGDFYGFIIADIPGLIEGASQGKGLGFKFLRHIKRTKTLFHCISLENENISAEYKTIRAELNAYDKELSEKQEIIILTKTDLVDAPALKKKIAEAKKLNKNVLTVSVYDDASIKELGDSLIKILREQNPGARLPTGASL